MTTRHAGRLRGYRGGPPRGSQEADDAIERQALDLMQRHREWEEAALEALGSDGIDDPLLVDWRGLHRWAFDETDLDDELDDDVADILDGSASQSADADESRIAAPPMTLEYELEYEARRTSVGRDRQRRDLLIASARPHAHWASDQGVPNVRVRARFAILTAFDEVWTAKIRETLHVHPRPLVWGWGPVKVKGVRRHYQKLWPGPDGSYRPPILPRDFHRLGAVKEVSLKSDSFAERAWEGVRPHLRYFDAVRPPLIALHIAAKLIRMQAHPHREVLAVNLGHSFGAQALSVWLRSTRVWTESTLFNPDLTPWIDDPPGDPARRYGKRRPSLEPGTVDAAVVNLPDRVAEEFLQLALDEDEPLTRFAIDELWDRPRIQPSVDWEYSLVRATKNLRPGGVLVVLGDTVSGATHIADEQLAELGFDRLDIGGSTHKVTTYERPEWSPYGALPPTGRVVSAWRRSK